MDVNLDAAVPLCVPAAEGFVILLFVVILVLVGPVLDATKGFATELKFFLDKGMLLSSVFLLTPEVVFNGVEYKLIAALELFCGFRSFFAVVLVQSCKICSIYKVSTKKKKKH